VLSAVWYSVVSCMVQLTLKSSSQKCNHTVLSGSSISDSSIRMFSDCFIRLYRFFSTFLYLTEAELISSRVHVCT